MIGLMPAEREDARHVRDTIARAALVFYEDGRWRPFAENSPESRVTSPEAATTVQFNSVPGRPPHAEYRGPFGRWWVRIDPSDGQPIEEPVFAPSADATSRRVN